MPAIGFFHRIHRQGADRVGHVFVINHESRAIVATVGRCAGSGGFHRIILNLLASGEDARSTRQNQPSGLPSGLPCA
jgi:coenzyme F420-reducing hydrogenase gamma subunit